jgi:hypothetical protein
VAKPEKIEHKGENKGIVMTIISSKSAWTLEAMETFLDGAVIPIRIAVLDGQFPLICSIWFYFDASTKQFVCASHERSKLIRVLEKVDRCGFEIATNDSPYRGIRGKAVATLSRANVSTSLHRLVDRYLGSTNAGLGQWLLSRVDEEYEIRLTPTWMTAWDYGQRMDPIAG